MKTDKTDRSKSVWRAAGIVSFAFVVSRVLGLGRQMVINGLYGASSIEATAYETASRFPELIFFVIAGGALGSAFIPTFAQYWEEEGEPAAWQLFSGVVNLVVVATVVVVGITALMAPQIVLFFLGDLVGGTPELFDLTVVLLRIMLLTPIIFGISGVVMATLNARYHFAMPAIAPIIYNIGIIVGALVWAPNVKGLAVGMVLGALGHLLVQLPALRAEGVEYHLSVSLQDKGIRQVLRLMAPRVLGLSFSQINHLITTFLAQSMVLGSIPALGIAWRVMLLPQGVLGQALGIATFPTLSAMAVGAKWAEMRQLIAQSLRSIFFLGLPATLQLMFLREQVVALLFERGQFTAADTILVADTLFFFALGITALSALEVIARAFYALQDTTTPVVAGGMQLLLMGVLGYILGQWLFPSWSLLPVGGLALAVTLSNFMEVGILLWLLGQRIEGIDGEYLWAGAWRMMVCGLGLAVVTWLSLLLLGDVWVVTELVVAGVIGGLAYIGLAWWMGLDELNLLIRLGERILGRVKGLWNRFI
ncbi:MAG TPA: murein biosynthesis integral membrane protein MurJ [Anaerolineae bacterium]|nr:murein biosynthesis integral membrane protein MurJ [Anaerolineae bacterium]